MSTPGKVLYGKSVTLERHLSTTTTNITIPTQTFPSSRPWNVAQGVSEISVIVYSQLPTKNPGGPCLLIEHPATSREWL